MSIGTIRRDAEDIDIRCEPKKFGVSKLAEFRCTNWAKIERVEKDDSDATIRDSSDEYFEISPPSVLGRVKMGASSPISISALSVISNICIYHFPVF